MAQVHLQLQSETVTRRRSFTLRGQSIADLADSLKRERFSGSVHVVMGQGGIISVVVEENVKLPLDSFVGGGVVSG